jgi:predicted nucleic acid-binding protein
MTETTEEDSAHPIKVAFDTSVLIGWHRRSEGREPELEALDEILELKRADAVRQWRFLYIDGARREFSGRLLERLAREDAEIADLLSHFEPPVMLFRLPTILPCVVSGAARAEAEAFFLARSVSKADALLLGDAVFLGCTVCVTMDRKLRNNAHAAKEAFRRYELQIVTTSEFLSLMKETIIEVSS